MRPWEYLCHHSTQIKAVNRDPGGREESENISLLFLLTMTCVCGDEMVWVHISFFFFLSLCVEVGYEKRLKRCAKPISWLCGRSAGCQQSPIYLLPPLPVHYTLGNIHLWMHGGQRLVYLLNNLGCGVAFSVMRRGRLTVRRPRVGVHSPRVFFTIPASLLASHYTPARLTGRNAQICVLICGLTSTYANLHTRTHELTHTSDHFQPNELAAPRVHDIHPTTTPIQFPCWWNWIYSIDASKHTGVWGVYYSAADERLHGLYCAIIIVITVIIWPSFGSFNERATFIPGSISVWNDAGMTWGTEQIDLGRQGRNACQFAIKVHALYLPEPD